MSEEYKEVLINFVKYNKFYKEENGNLTMSINIGAKEMLDKAIKNLLDIVEKKGKIINLMAEDLNDFYDDIALEYKERTIEDTIKKYKKELDELLKEE